jgi:hypothetical protein
VCELSAEQENLNLLKSLFFKPNVLQEIKVYFRDFHSKLLRLFWNDEFFVRVLLPTINENYFPDETKETTSIETAKNGVEVKEEPVTPAPPPSEVKAPLPAEPTPEKKREEEWDLPHTITKLESPSGGQIYLVGTAHFSKESQEDVAKVKNILRKSHEYNSIDRLLYF